MTSSEGHSTLSLSRGRLIAVLAGALAVATAVAICVILPAETGRDPTGFGHATGLVRLAGAKPVTIAVPTSPGAATRFYPAAFRTDEIDIPLAAAADEQGRDELEYKVRMRSGQALVYSWTVPEVGNPAEFYFDFHGESVGQPKAQVIEYRQATGVRSNGALVAPMDGIHGWYLQNQSSKPVTVHLKLSGFYELVPPGQPGNLAGLAARPDRD